MPMNAEIVGNIAQTPVLDESGDHPVLRCLVFVDRYRRNEQGRLDELAGFLQAVSYFGDKASDYKRILNTGMRIFCDCSVSPNEFETKGEGDQKVKNSGFNLVAKSIKLELGPRVLGVEMRPSKREQELELSEAAG